MRKIQSRPETNDCLVGKQLKRRTAIQNNGETRNKGTVEQVLTKGLVCQTLTKFSAVVDWA